MSRLCVLRVGALSKGYFKSAAAGDHSGEPIFQTFFNYGYKLSFKKNVRQVSFQRCGDRNKDGVRTAFLRAIADMLYFNPRKYFDAGDSGLINWEEIKKIADAVGYNIKKC